MFHYSRSREPVSNNAVHASVRASKIGTLATSQLHEMPLPIEPVLPELRRALRARTEAVLQAPPGAGKTTMVPTSLLEEDWLDGQRIVVLEPRRLAARAAAHRMAKLRGERVGQSIGYRVRMDTKVSSQTRVEVVTEGVLTRFVQEDPSLEGIGLVIFDEFHERSLQADLGLALTLESRRIFRDDLRVLVMSATLASDAVAKLLGDAPVITSEGRSFPVETHYLDHPTESRIEDVAARTIRKALHENEDGDVLVFLPGAGEIRRTESRLDDRAPNIDVYPLFGNLPQKAQDEAIEPSPPGRRKVVLSTDIAETSLTIEGVRVVVDSGLMRVPRFSPRSGMTRLATIPVSKASADQRRGRAGRLGPGACYRLWTRLEQQHLDAHSPPEILQADLAPLALELANWGVTDPSTLRWMDPPPAGAFSQAIDLLHHLGALDEDGTVTEHGRHMAALGLHPRLAHMTLSAKTLGLADLACDVAALLSERDVFKSREGVVNADLRLRLQALKDVAGRDDFDSAPGFQIDQRAARHVLRVSRHWRRKLGAPAGKTSREGAHDHPDRMGTPRSRRGGREPYDIEAAGLLLAFAYPDRIAQKAGGRFRLRNGRIAGFAEPQLLSDAAFLVAADLGERRHESRIFLAAPVTLEDLEAHFGEQIEEVESVHWGSGIVRARRQRQLGALVLQDGPIANPDPDKMAGALVEGIRQEGLSILPWTKNARRLQDRLVFMHRRDSDWPDTSDAALLGSLEDWLKPHLYGMKRAEDLQKLDLTSILFGMVGWDRREELDERAPTHVTVPSGSRIPIEYADPASPVLAVRLQELFGATETPRIDRGRVPLTLHLLSPAHRPMQVTQDLANFWRDTYFEVRKDLRGRYPKHYWPEDPLEAEPTNRAKPRKR